MPSADGSVPLCGYIRFGHESVLTTMSDVHKGDSHHTWACKNVMAWSFGYFEAVQIRGMLNTVFVLDEV